MKSSTAEGFTQKYKECLDFVHTEYSIPEDFGHPKEKGQMRNKQGQSLWVAQFAGVKTEVLTDEKHSQETAVPGLANRLVYTKHSCLVQ